MPFGEDGSVVRREFARQAETFVKIDEKLDCTAYTVQDCTACTIEAVEGYDLTASYLWGSDARRTHTYCKDDAALASYARLPARRQAMRVFLFYY